MIRPPKEKVNASKNASKHHNKRARKQTKLRKHNTVSVVETVMEQQHNRYSVTVTVESCGSD